MARSTRSPSRIGVQVADSVDASEFVAGDLGNLEPGLGHAHVYECLDLESVTPERVSVVLRPREGNRIEVENRQMATPKYVVPVAQV